MICLRFPATGAALASLFLFACRDAPTGPERSADSVAAPSFSADSAGELPGPASIVAAYTEIAFYDGSHGGEPLAEFRVGMEYIGNNAWMGTNYSITGAATSLKDKIVNQQNAFYNPTLNKRFDQIYYVPTGVKCGLLLEANTQHQAWWLLYLRWLPFAETAKVFQFTHGIPLQLEPCEPEPAPSGGSGGSGAGGGWVSYETCYYWAHYVNGVLVSIELRYCEYGSIPIADE